MPILTPLAAASLKQWGFLSSAQLAATDPYFAYTTLLLHGDGTNGAQNNTFLDSSTNNFTITRNGNTTQGTFSPFSQGDGKWGAYFDGSGDFLDAGQQTAFDLGTGAFTVEAWIYVTTLASVSVICTYSNPTRNANGDQAYGFQVSTSGELDFSWTTGASTATSITSSSSAIFANTWHHVVAVKNSGTDAAIFIDGVRAATGTISTTMFTPASRSFKVGRQASNFATRDFDGYISNFRLVKGTAVYDPTQTTLTVPTAPLTAITNTSLLTCQSNRFKDNSANNFAITVNGNTSIQPFSPFAPSAAYSAATNGGSGYFDGSGDYLTAGSASDWAFLNNGSSFTIECFVYVSSATTTQRIVSTTTQSAAVGFSFHINSNSTITLRINNGTATTTFTSTGTISANSWNHVAVTFNTTGKTATFYINGSSAGSSSDAGFSYLASNPTNTINIGRAPEDVSYITGYISTLRITNTVVYNSSFTTPATPLTAISGTSLLLNFTNTGILDNTGRNDLETVGNAQISTSVKKFGTGSLAFDGTGDYLAARMTPEVVFGSGDMTIECWVYANTISGIDTIFDTRTSGSFGAESFLLQLNAGVPQVWAGSYSGASPVAAGSAAISTSTWTHIAFTRASGTNRLFVNGTSVASNSNSWTQTLVTSNPYYIGQTVGVDRPFDGYIDDLRITKGVARYTANFTPPTAAFEDQ